MTNEKHMKALLLHKCSVVLHLKELLRCSSCKCSHNPANQETMMVFLQTLNKLFPDQLTCNCWGISESMCLFMRYHVHWVSTDTGPTSLELEFSSLTQYTQPSVYCIT